MLGDAQPVGAVARLQLRVESVGRAEKGDAQGLAEALEAVTQGDQNAVGVQPFGVAFGFLGMGPVTIAVDSYGPVTDNDYEIGRASCRERV